MGESDEAVRYWLLSTLRKGRAQCAAERARQEQRSDAFDHVINLMEATGAVTIGDLLRQIDQQEPVQAARLRDALRLLYGAD